MPDQETKLPKKPFARLLADLRKRYPSSKDADSKEYDESGKQETHPASPNEQQFNSRIGKLPKEAGALLVVIGVAGLLLPGPVGSPFVLAGGLVLWPSAFGRVESWFERMFPRMHHEGITQINRFLGDLEVRYPGSTA